MGRPYSRPLTVAVTPITGSEVHNWWCEILRRGPRPSAEACSLQAKHLNAHIRHGIDIHQRARDDAKAAAAARSLLATVSARLQPLEATSGRPLSDYRYSPDAYAIFAAGRLAIVEMLAELDPINFRITPEQGSWFTGDEDRKRRLDALTERIPYRARAPVWQQSAIVCWLIGCDALTAIGRKGGTTADSAAVKFAARAVQYLGFSSSRGPITANAVAKRLARQEWARGK